MKEFWTAFLNAQREFPTIVKDSDNPHFKSKYAALDTILNAVKPALHKHGIVITMPIEDDTVIVCFTHAESAQSISSHSKLCLSDAEKHNEQKRKSAITYQRRANLEGLAGIAAEDDDDGQAAVTKVDSEYDNTWELARSVADKMKLKDSIRENIEAYKDYFKKNYRKVKSEQDAKDFINAFLAL